MRKISLILGTLGTVIFLASCSTVQTTVIPKAHGNYEVIATAQNSANAQRGAINKATKVCQEQGKTLVVKKNRTIYQGSGRVCRDARERFTPSLVQIDSHCATAN